MAKKNFCRASALDTRRRVGRLSGAGSPTAHMTNRNRNAIVLLVFAQGLAGCGSAGPSAPSAAHGISSPPVVTAISVNTGSSSGGTPVHITGTGFEMGVTVTFGTASVERRGYDPRVNPEAHPVPFISARLPMPRGLWMSLSRTRAARPLRLANAYQYRVQQLFDFNGNWNGGGSDGSHVGVQLTIRNNLLISSVVVM